MWFFVVFILGVARPITVDEVCHTQWRRDHRYVNADMKRQVANRDHTTLVGKIVDHVIPRELGGADVIDNLQVQCCFTRGHITGPAHTKDVQENRMKRAVCQGTVSLDAAQSSFKIVR